MRSIIGIGLLGMSLLTGCVILDGSFHEVGLEHLRIERADYPNWPWFSSMNSQDYYPEEALIEGDGVSFKIPSNIDARRLRFHALYRGAEAVFDQAVSIESADQGSLTATVDLSTTRLMTVTAMDGRSRVYRLKAVHEPLQVGTISLTRTNNPTLRRMKTWTANISSGDELNLPIPDYFDAQHSILSFTANAEMWLEETPILSDVTPVDLSVRRTLQLKNASGLIKTTHLNPFEIPAENVSSLNPTYLVLRPTLLQGIDGHQTGATVLTFWPPSEGQGSIEMVSATNWVLHPEYRADTNWSRIYLSLNMKTGMTDDNVECQIGTNTLVKGDPVWHGIYSPNNWIDLTKPVVLTVTAEDLSTRDITLTLGSFQ